MADGSFSWDQPDSRGLGGWEGFCGQTATANLLTTHEGTNYSPRDVAEKFSDLSPGSHPSTLMIAIKALASTPSRYQLGNNSMLLHLARPRSPIICLLAWGAGTSYHYVSVVGIRSSDVYFNHWGTQHHLPRVKFMKWWGFRDKGTLSNIAASMGNLDPHTSIRWI